MKINLLLLLCASLNLTASALDLQVNLVDHYFAGGKKKPLDLPKTDDYAFVRRAYLDLTGVIPTPDQMNSFVADQNPEKRPNLIDQILQSDGFSRRWTVFFEDLLWNKRQYNGGLFLRTAHQTMYDMVAQNRSWKEIAVQLITESGNMTESGSYSNLYASEFFEDNIQLDIMDNLAGNISEYFLGIQINCISCHNGAYHLEDVNMGLSTMTRDQFWGMAAFLSGVQMYAPRQPADYRGNYERMFEEMSLVDLDDPGFDMGRGHFPLRQRFYKPTGEYEASSEPGKGTRVARNGGLIKPRYLFSGEEPAEGETRRQALARMITSDRQFARQMTNRIWEQLVGVGFISQPNAWDPLRLDPDSAAEIGTTVQARDWILLEELTEFFIQNDFDIRQLIGHIMKSSLYQVDYSQFKAFEHDSNLRYWISDRRIRRIEAEAIFDSIYQTLEVPQKYAVGGDQLLMVGSTWDIADTLEPNLQKLLGLSEEQFKDLGYQDAEEYYLMQAETRQLLSIFGRSDRILKKPRDNNLSSQAVLALLNNHELLHPLNRFGFHRSPWLVSLTDQYNSGTLGPQELIQQIYLRILVRPPTAAEIEVTMPYLETEGVEGFIFQLAWTLFNHHQFLYK